MKQKKFKIADSKKGNFPVSPHGHIEPHECPAYQPILLPQEPIHEILAEIAQLLAMLKHSVFEFFFQKKKKYFLLLSHENKSQIMC